MPSPTTVLLRTQSDDRLVALARAGHERAFEAIVERYRKPLLRACRRILPEARAEDAVQQALVAAWTGLSRGDDVQDLRPWLYRIAHNTALNQLRVAGYDHDELQGLLDGGPAPEEELERREVARRTLTGLAALPPRQRDALLQIAVQGRGQDEVARAMGVSEPAVRQLVHRARTQLRAAATAVTPMPVAAWLSDFGSGSAPVTDRIGEIVAGGSAAATAAKVGAIVAIAGGAAAGGPGVVDRLAREHAGASARAAETRHVARARPAGASAVDVAATVPAPSMHRPAHGPAAKPVSRGARRHEGSGERRETSSGHGSDHSGTPVIHRRSGRDESDGDDHRGSSGSGDSGGSSGSSGSSGPGSGGSDDGGGGGHHDGSSGTGGGGDDDHTVALSPAPGSEPISEPTGGGDGDHHGDAPTGASPTPTPVPTPTSTSGSGGGSGHDGGSTDADLNVAG